MRKVSKSIFNGGSLSGLYGYKQLRQIRKKKIEKEGFGVVLFFSCWTSTKQTKL